MSNINEFNLPGLLKQYPDGILIPKIQRDYAQGRADAKASDVRKNFLNAIFEGKVKSLDFIFGTVDDRNRFIPIDGQQRLTTLFLLYLYAKKTKELYKDLDLSKFSYDTRRAARDFCKAVVENKWDIKDRLEGDSVSYSIKISNWFMDYWQYDPTVASMLNMLDDIHIESNGFNFYQLDEIKFYFFDMEEERNLNENLYVKMNSRGKPLTSFENMKASIEKMLEEKDKNGNSIISPDKDSFYEAKDTLSGDTFKDKWTYHIDREWTDWFWINRPNKDKNHSVDVEFTQFICRFLAGFTRIFGDAEKTNKQIQETLCINAKVDSFIPFEPVKNALVNGAFEALAKVLMGFSCNDWSGLTASNWGEKITKIDEYKSLAVIQGYLIGLRKGEEECKKWLRFCWNMAENYVVSADTYLIFCNYLRMLNNEKDLYQNLTEKTFDTSSAQLSQLSEEINKARQILCPQEESTLPQQPSDWKEGKEWNWETAIIQAENYAFFCGAIRFLFTNKDGSIDWTSFNDKWNNVQLLISESEPCHCTRDMLPYLSDNSIKTIFSGCTLSNKAANLRKLLLTYSSNVHNWLIQGDESQDKDSLLHSHLYCVVEKHPDFWLHLNWVHNLDVLSNYVNRSGDYQNHSIVVGSDIFGKAIELLSKVGSITFSQSTTMPIVGLYVKFTYNHEGHDYTFRWQASNWVDMYEGDVNLYDKGGEYEKLHTYFGDTSEFCFSDSSGLVEELKRCIIKYVELTKT